LLAIILFGSWDHAARFSDGCQLWPSAGTLITYTISFVLLARPEDRPGGHGVRDLVAAGTALIAAIGILFLGERDRAPGGIALILVGVVILNLGGRTSRDSVFCSPLTQYVDAAGRTPHDVHGVDGRVGSPAHPSAPRATGGPSTPVSRRPRCHRRTGDEPVDAACRSILRRSSWQPTRRCHFSDTDEPLPVLSSLPMDAPGRSAGCTLVVVDLAADEATEIGAMA
jgi:multidrug transporter EmrE-like cation transporter